MRTIRLAIIFLIVIINSMGVFALLAGKPDVKPVTYDNIRIEVFEVTKIRAYDVKNNVVLWEKKFFSTQNGNMIVEDADVVTGLKIEDDRLIVTSMGNVTVSVDPYSGRTREQNVYYFGTATVLILIMILVLIRVVRKRRTAQTYVVDKEEM